MLQRLFVFTAFFCFLLLLGLCDSAKYCYSGQNSRFAPKHCSSGSFDVNYVCQKYTCGGGRSPFVLRTCAMKSMGCMAGSRICKFSGGKGSCDRCEGDLCNSVAFIFRDCADETETNCSRTAKLCEEYSGNGRCFACVADLCNEKENERVDDDDHDDADGINDGGQSIINDNGQLVINNNGQLVINDGGQSIINDDGQLIINDDGQSIINDDGQNDEGQSIINDDGQNDEGQSIINDDGQSIINDDGQSIIVNCSSILSGSHFQLVVLLLIMLISVY